MHPIEPQKKPGWRLTALTLLMVILLSGFAGLFLTSVVQDFLGRQPIFPSDWSFVLLGMVLLAGELVQETQRELTEGPDRRNPTTTMGLMAVGLFIVAPGTVLKIVFGSLLGLSALLVGIGLLKGKKKTETPL